MTKFKLRKKCEKINLRIISKPHAYLQRMVKTSVKFQKNRSKTVGGVAHTRYILYRGRKDGRTDLRTDRRTDRRMDGMTESQKLCPSAFLRKGGGQKFNGFHLDTITRRDDRASQHIYHSRIRDLV